MENKIKQKKRVSYSQYAKWFKCPHSWQLDYLMNLRTYEGSINTCFGTAIHEAFQLYIEKLYVVGHVEADSLNLYDIFKIAFERELKDEKNKVKYTNDEYTEFCFDGDDIIKTFVATSNRLKNFPSKKYEFIGSELPLEVDIRNNVQFVAFLDLVLKDKDTGKYKIIDFKTSSSGWNSYMKEDESKYSQLLLYKAFYSKKFNVSLEDIEVEFFILKRRLLENMGFPQSRIQKFAPTNTKSAVAQSLTGFTTFINECFTVDGTYKVDGKFPKVPGKGKKNCKYCVHKKVNCDAKEDKEEE